MAALKRQFVIEPWKSGHAEYTNLFPDCVAMLSSADMVPDGGWGPAELMQRDITAIRLRVIHEMVSLSLLLENQVAVKDGIIEKLGSTDAALLAEADDDLLRISQQTSQSDVHAALVAGLWDAYIEPATGAVTDQDVVRASFTFRDKQIDNHCAARESFQCYWEIVLPPSPEPVAQPSRVNWLTRAFSSKKPSEPQSADTANPVASADKPPGGTALPSDSATDEDAVYELGWDVQFMPQRGRIVVTPEVYDSDGQLVPIQQSEKNKGQASLDVVAPPSTVLRARVVRGLLDAIITALVPVVTVAIANVGQSGSLPIEKLVLLGFTSQAIRSAIVPGSDFSARGRQNQRQRGIVDLEKAAGLGRDVGQKLLANRRRYRCRALRIAIHAGDHHPSVRHLSFVFQDTVFQFERRVTDLPHQNFNLQQIVEVNRTPEIAFHVNTRERNHLAVFHRTSRPK